MNWSMNNNKNDNSQNDRTDHQLSPGSAPNRASLRQVWVYSATLETR